MVAEILSIGTELLMGQIANTDAQYISRRLSELGVALYRHTVVGDNPGRVREALETALSRSDIVITTGGLGPTEHEGPPREVLGEERVEHHLIHGGVDVAHVRGDVLCVDDDRALASPTYFHDAQSHLRALPEDVLRLIRAAVDKHHYRSERARLVHLTRVRALRV